MNADTLRAGQWRGYGHMLLDRVLGILVDSGISVGDVRREGASCLLPLRGIGVKTAAYLVDLVVDDTHLGETHWSPSLVRWLDISACGLWHARLNEAPNRWEEGTLTRDSLVHPDGIPTCPRCLEATEPVPFWEHTEPHPSMDGLKHWQPGAVGALCPATP